MESNIVMITLDEYNDLKNYKKCFEEKGVIVYYVGRRTTIGGRNFVEKQIVSMDEINSDAITCDEFNDLKRVIIDKNEEIFENNNKEFILKNKIKSMSILDFLKYRKQLNTIKNE